MAISPIPTTRVSELLIQQRLLSQLRSDQSAVFQLQTAVSTGKKFTIPSESPSAALRSITLQRLIEQKSQVRANLLTSESFLAATDSAINSVSGLISDARAAAISVADSIDAPEARKAAAQEIEEIISRLVETGNRQFRDRYLFAGSKSRQLPFELVDKNVVYRGNEGSLNSYSDTDVLFATNVAGATLFGAVSTPVGGAVDLNPVLTNETRLSLLRGGRGISPGSIAINNGSATSVIDISEAETIGDVVRLLESNPPTGSQVRAFVNSDGLQIQLSSGNLSITEVGAGTTASELGVLQNTGVGTGPVFGNDLDPVLTRTTPLDDILGTRAEAKVISNFSDGSFLVRANRNGDSYNDFAVTLQAGGTLGAELVTYDPVGKTITVSVAENLSTAADVVDAINASAAAADFTALLPHEKLGSGVVQLGTVNTQGGGGEIFDKTSGLHVVNGGEEFVIDLSDADTIEDVLNILNASDAGVLVEVNDARTGIDIRTRVSGSDFQIGENGGTTASQLGIRSFTENSQLSDLNFGVGVETTDGTDFVIQRKDGTQLNIDLNAGLSATLEIDGADPNDALRIRVLPPSSDGNNFSLEITDSGPGGGDTVSLVGSTLTFSADLGAGFTAQDAINLLAGDVTLSAQFVAELDDTADPGNTGAGNLTPLVATPFSGGLDQARTVGDVLEYINRDPNNLTSSGRVTARLAAFGNGIELVDDNLAAAGTLTVTKSLGANAAIDLGFLAPQTTTSGPPSTATPATATINGADPNDALLFSTTALGAGGNAFSVEITDSGPGGGNVVSLVGNTLTYAVDLGAGFTAQNAITLLAGDPTLSAQFTAQLDAGLDPGNNGTGQLAATGPIAFNGGQAESLVSQDVNAQESLGVFTALVRIRDALLADDLIALGRGIQVLDESADQMGFVRADLGARLQNLDLINRRLDDEEVELQSTLSRESEVDLVEAIVQLNARQASLEASLQTIGQFANLSLLDFL
ncbi:MAG: hypothetical protein MPJ50_00515 [Pirellulales bacterium]|nr:hypothetical protein [Pirellulales bacterium]